MGNRIIEGSSVCVALALALGCGGGAATQPDEATVRDETSSETIATVAPEEEVEAEATTDGEAPAPAEEPETPPTPPPPEPITATNADELKAALYAAASDIEAFRRFVDPELGIGVYDAGESNITHYCDMENLGSHAGLGFVMNESDTFRCDDRMRRCMNRGTDGSGTAFYFRDAAGDTITLDTIVQYARRAPNTDGSAVVTFAGAGEGVCALYRRTRDASASPAGALSVFVSSQTGLVPEVLAEHHCGDAAAAAYRERIAPLASSRPTRCDRNPSRCTWTSTDEEITVYGDAEGAPTTVTITRPGMVQNLARAQQRDLDAFMARARRHRCDAE